MNYPLSDHFDGKKFHNPQSQDRGFWDFVKLLWNHKPAEWPDSIEVYPQKVPIERVKNGQLYVTYINHSTTLIQIDGLNVLTDPIWSQRASPFSSIGPKRVRQPGVLFEDLPPIDIVLVSHNHYDHMDLPTLQRLQHEHRPLFITPLGNKPYLEKHGMTNVEELDWWERSFLSSQLPIYLVPSQHFSSRWLWDRNQTLWGGFVIKGNQHTVYFAGDTGYNPFFKEIKECFGPPDLAILPIGAYQPQWFMHPAHMSPAEAVLAYQDLEAKQALAIHFGIFRLTEEKIDQPQHDLLQALKEHHLSPDNFWVLEPGMGKWIKPSLEHSTRR